ncbi:MAG: hypothetical protein M9916_13365 [Crocinitomicaceae bacterium]|nr:hypothetical protein [Crocinitomicaceae bacterium]
MYNIDYYSLLFSPINILSGIIFLFLVIILMQFKSNSIAIIDEKEARLYRFSVYYKLLFSLLFSVYYIIIFKGGDTYAYWKTTEALQNLMFTDFDKFWDIITSAPTMEKYQGYFNYRIGYPMRFIYIEEESYFVTKIFLCFRFFTLGSYLSTTILVAFIVANSSWRLYKIIKEFNLFDNRLIIIFILFLPSVSFWASGISKDTIVMISIFYMVWSIYNILNRKHSSGNKFKYYITLIFFVFLIYKIRPFILNAMIVPLLIMYFTGLINKIKDFVIAKIMIKGILYVAIIGAILYAFVNISADEVLQSSDSFSEAMIVQKDFQTNTAVYGDEEGKRYSLGEVDFSPMGIVKVIPASIIAGIYRPYIWEALNPSLLFNGIESVLFIILTLNFFFNHFKLRYRAIKTNEILIFSFGFVLIIAFMAGFTSILFGVLVRIRAPLLPFLGLLLAIDWKKFQKQEEISKALEANEE